MADPETVTEEKIFSIEYAKQSRAACKKCKDKCLTGELRISKEVPSPFGSGKMKVWHHVHCIFEQFLNQRATTKRVQSVDDLDGWDKLSDEDKEEIENKIQESEKAIAEKYGKSPPPKKRKLNATKNIPSTTSPSSSNVAKISNITNDDSTTKTSNNLQRNISHRDLLFKGFRRVVADISNVDSYLEKTKVVSDLFTKGSDGNGFKGDIVQWCRLLLPGVIKRIYNLQSKQIIKLFSRIFHIDQTVMMEHLKKDDIGETIQIFFEKSTHFCPAKKSVLAIQEVDDFLEELSTMTKEEEQINHFKAIASKCTSNDLKLIIRLIKHDLRMNAGAKHILQGVHPDAYSVYQASRDINETIKRCLGGSSKTDDNPSRIKASINLMTPIQPMLAEACKSVEQAMKKCPNGMYAEIKYDGERVQLHKYGTEFRYFSRSLKPVLPHKVAHFKEYIPKAFPHGKDLILDCEILMIDAATGQPLPFGTLGVHKKFEFKDANVCLFVFDCMYYNGESLVNMPIKHRKNILKENMTEIPNRIMFSEMEIIKEPKHLAEKITEVLKKGLEGLVLKDLKSVYEPGKRHWLKVKKDYLLDGAMADSADLIVLGAWYGTGKKAGMKSVFLMGCYDFHTKEYYTVTKVHTGHDDKTLEQLQTELKMVEISANPVKVPDWLRCTKTMIPDFVAEDPKNQPVWEITGAEFTQHDVHTADGISIRFPRVTKIRDDKTWQTATSLEELKVLYRKSKENIDFRLDNLEGQVIDNNNGGVVSSPPKISGINKRSNNKKAKKRKNNDLEGLDDNNDACSSKLLQYTGKNSIKNLKTNITYTAAEAYQKIKNPLPDIFIHVKLLVEEDAQSAFKEWIRYFISYGGIVLKSEEWEKATHVLHLHDNVKEQDVICTKIAKHVTVKWIKNCVFSNKLIDFRPYSVVWDH